MEQLLLSLSVKGKSLEADSGSVMHGILMELLPQPWPTKLHQEGQLALTQWLEPKENGRSLWHIGLLSDELAQAMIQELNERSEIFSSHHQKMILTERFNHRTISLQDYLTQHIMLEEAPDSIRLFFRTPTTHKSQGEYVLFPSVNLIVGSLQKKCAQADPNSVLGDLLFGQQVIENCRISRYRLETKYFGLEGTRIPGYTGFVDLRLKGDPMLRKLMLALFGLAEFAGVGIKTALGMGGCRVINIKKEEKKLGGNHNG